MAKRVRSPNYPSMSLSDAIERLTKLGGEIHSHPAPRDVVVTSMGYSSVNGASLTALAALRKYGLLRRDGEDFRITERGMMYLHPQRADERSTAIRDAASEPKLFAELNERFSGGKASDELIRSFLVRNGFTPSAAAAALRSYRETMALVERECEEYDSESDELDEESASIEHQQPATPVSAHSGPSVHVGAREAATEGQFRVTMTDEFRVDVVASGLYRSEVKRLIRWLQANEELVPENRGPESGQDESQLNPNA